jgi:hypothetical protein
MKAVLRLAVLAVMMTALCGAAKNPPMKLEDQAASEALADHLGRIGAKPIGIQLTSVHDPTTAMQKAKGMKAFYYRGLVRVINTNRVAPDQLDPKGLQSGVYQFALCIYRKGKKYELTYFTINQRSGFHQTLVGPSTGKSGGAYPRS